MPHRCSLTNLAFALTGAGELLRAESTAVAAVSMAEHLYGPRHTRTGIAWTRLAEVQDRLGNRAEAEAYYRRALENFENGLATFSREVVDQRLQLLGKL